MRKAWIRIVGELAILLLLSAWGAPASAEQHSPQRNRDGSDARGAPGKAGPVLSDEALERAIRERFARSAIQSNGFTVSVAGGVATLKGTAKVAQHKGVATRLARSAGARTVRNQIELAPAARETMRKLREERKPGTGDHRKPGGPPRRATVSQAAPRGSLVRGSGRTENAGARPFQRDGGESSVTARASDGEDGEGTKRFAIIPRPAGAAERDKERVRGSPRRY